MSKLDNCYDKGLLKPANKEPDLAVKDLRQAKFFLMEAVDLLEIEKKIIASLSLYNAYFHAIRSLLFKDGIKERSHYCMARYLEEEYVNKEILDKKFLNAYETIMSIRHNAQYSTEEIEIDEDLMELINNCEELIKKVKELLK